MGFWAGFPEGGAAVTKFADVAGSLGDAAWPAAVPTNAPAIAIKMKKIGESFPRMMTSQVQKYISFLSMSAGQGDVACIGELSGQLQTVRNGQGRLRLSRLNLNAFGGKRVGVEPTFEAREGLERQL